VDGGGVLVEEVDGGGVLVEEVNQGKVLKPGRGLMRSLTGGV
jgi:hypothetical protein